MKLSTLFFMLAAVAGVTAAIAGCGSASPPPPAISQPPYPTASPAAKLLYVDHNGTFFEYRLPLATNSKPVRTLTEWPGLAVPPVIGADQYGNVAVGSPKELRLFSAPIVSFAPSRAKLRLTLTSAITEVGISGADLVDLEYDPNENLWLFNNLGADISELRAPVTKSSVAAVTIGFGIPGTKTAGFSELVQGRFDVNATLYVYATNPAPLPPVSRLFKIGFPYAKPPGPIELNLAQADFVDSSQWPPTAPIAPTLLLGQYTGQLRSPPPGVPPSPPVDVTAQFAQPFMPSKGLFPDAHINTITAALIADPYRARFYTLDADNGSLNVYGLPMTSNAAPKVSLPCLAGVDNCGAKPQHLFLAP
jgi:hypothetical protein